MAIYKNHPHHVVGLHYYTVTSQYYVYIRSLYSCTHTDHWMGKSRGPKIEIDYDKLKELCGRSIPKERRAQSAMG